MLYIATSVGYVITLLCDSCDLCLLLQWHSGVLNVVVAVPPLWCLLLQWHCGVLTVFVATVALWCPNCVCYCSGTVVS